MHNIKIERILIGVNFTDVSRRAFYTGLNLAAKYGAETYAMHVAEPIRAYDFSKSRYTETRETIERVEEGVTRRIDELWQEGGLDAVDRRKVHIVVRGGKAAQELVEAAVAKKIDLIVIGAGTAEGGLQQILGSTAERVVRNAPCSVLCVRLPVA